MTVSKSSPDGSRSCSARPSARSRHYSEAHGIFLYKRDEGGFEGWVEARLKISRSTAYRLLNVHEHVESIPQWDTLPLGVLYQLCELQAEAAREEIVKLAEAGEVISSEVAKKVLAKTKKKKAKPAAQPVSPPPASSSPIPEPAADLIPLPPVPPAVNSNGGDPEEEGKARCPLNAQLAGDEPDAGAPPPVPPESTAVHLIDRLAGLVNRSAVTVHTLVIPILESILDGGRNRLKSSWKLSKGKPPTANE
jgi:hypothetical protein